VFLKIKAAVYLDGPGSYSSTMTLMRLQINLV